MNYLRLAGVVVLGGALFACQNGNKENPAATSAAPSKEPEAAAIRVAMSAAFVSQSGVGVYRQMTDYVAKKAGRKVELIDGLSYESINKMLASGDVDVGFVCGLPYVLLHDKPTAEADLLVAPVMKAARYGGKPKYFSDLIVRIDSPYKKLEDLKGKPYVYNDELSNSGYNLPRFRLVSAGLTDGFFGSLKRSGSHEESIRMVASGEAEASYVDSLVLEYDQARGGTDANKVRVIDSIGPAGIPPVVVSAKVPEPTRQLLRRILVEMNTTPEGRKILDSALVEKFVAVDDNNFDDIREMKQKAEQAKYLSLR
jgi:phosphonate transport system substrate-binding protein